jgi:hypothetical protein
MVTGGKEPIPSSVLGAPSPTSGAHGTVEWLTARRICVLISEEQGQLLLQQREKRDWSWKAEEQTEGRVMGSK